MMLTRTWRLHPEEEPFIPDTTNPPSCMGLTIWAQDDQAPNFQSFRQHQRNPQTEMHLSSWSVLTQTDTAIVQLVDRRKVIFCHVLFPLDHFILSHIHLVNKTDVQS